MEILPLQSTSSWETASTMSDSTVPPPPAVASPWYGRIQSDLLEPVVNPWLHRTPTRRIDEWPQRLHEARMYYTESHTAMEQEDAARDSIDYDLPAYSGEVLPEYTLRPPFIRTRRPPLPSPARPPRAAVRYRPEPPAYTVESPRPPIRETSESHRNVRTGAAGAAADARQTLPRPVSAKSDDMEMHMDCSQSLLKLIRFFFAGGIMITILCLAVRAGTQAQ